MALLPDLRIETKRLLLRSPEETDIDSIAAEVNDFEVARMLARVPFPYSRADAEDFLAATRRSEEDLNLVITREGRAIGCMGLAQVPATCEFGYWLGRAHWGQGFATEAGRAFLEACFEALDLDTIRSGVFLDNPASLHVQEKLGFVPTGHSLRESWARGRAVEHTDTVLTRARFLERTR